MKPLSGFSPDAATPCNWSTPYGNQVGRDKNAPLWAIEAHCKEGYHGCFSFPIALQIPLPIAFPSDFSDVLKIW